MGLVDHLAQVKEALKDPSVREVVANISPQLLDLFPEDHDDGELDDAKKGKPASSKPALTSPSTPPAASPTLSVHPVKPAFTPLPEETAVNSATHRSAHARLVRRMEKVDPAVFPNMCKLWQGNRKD